MSTNTGIRIIVAEDDPLFSQLVSQLLQPLLKALPGSMVIFASSIEAAFAAVSDVPRPDVLLLDLTMPPIGMAETLTRLDQLEQCTPVVILTGSQEEAVRKIIGSRPTPILEKDRVVRNPSLLHMAICAVIELWQNQRHARTRENIRIMKAACHAPEG